MQVFGLMIVRNEVDIVRVNVAHHLALGVDQFLIIDNGSTDGTDRVLEDLSADPRVRWTRCEGEFRQADFTTELAREAYLRGADWVLPIDADEFFYTPGRDLREVLGSSSAGALLVEVVNFVQRREQVAVTPDALIHMTRRSERPIGPISRIQELVESRQIGFVEHEYAPKWISRASPALQIAQGNHSVGRPHGPLGATRDIVCLHAPLRARSALEAKVDQARPISDIEHYLRLAWHIRMWRQRADEGLLDQEWMANSYSEECLDVYGAKHRLVYDPTLRDVVAPWIGAPALPPRKNETASYSAPLRLDLSYCAKQEGVVSAALAHMREIEGWLEEPEARLLMVATATALAQQGPLAIVEVGSYCGRSTVVLGSVALAVCPEAKVYAIDPHQGEVTLASQESHFESPTLRRFTGNIAAAGLAGVVETIVGHSYEVAWDRPIALLYIDGLHDYENVSRDFRHFEAWIAPGGYVAFDDYEHDQFPGVVALVEEVVSTGLYREVQRVGRMVVIQKVG